MWRPTTASEIETAARSGDLRESQGFDGKAALPTSNRNVDLAVDIRAMTVDGGQLLYGVGEDADGQLTVLSPINLAGARERVDQVAQTSITESPFIEIETFECDSPGRGYVLITVPQSPRAPHQVTVGKNLRFYGRGDVGNRVLAEGDIARLYVRRERWEVDAAAELAKVMAYAPFPAEEEPGHLHAFARPVIPDIKIWDRIEDCGREVVLNRLRSAAASFPRSQNYDPALSRAGSNWKRRGADVWSLDSEGTSPTFAVRADLNIDGRGSLFCGRATDRQPPRWSGDEPIPVLMEVIVAGNLASFFAVMGAYYEAAGYRGHVDVGVAVDGIEGARSFHRRGSGGFDTEAYGAPTFTRTARVAAVQLEKEPQQVALGLIRHLLEATASPGYPLRLSH